MSRKEQNSRKSGLGWQLAGMSFRRALCIALCAMVLNGAMSNAAASSSAKSDGASKPVVIWAASWGSAQLQPYGSEVLPAGALNSSTLRQVVHLSAGGTKLRLRLSNLFGQQPLQLSSVHVALRVTSQAGGDIELATDHAVTFAGDSNVVIPMGTDYVSDAITMALPPQADLVVTFFVMQAPTNVTFHAGAHATSLLIKGEHVTELRFDTPQTFTRWYFLSGVETATDGVTGSTAVALGDSITDGHGSTTDGNDRWPDVLARRMSANAATMHMGVVNEGIGGNRVLADGLGPSALARFDRDVLSIAGVKTLIVMEGINDLGVLDRTEIHSQAAHDALVKQLMAAFCQMVITAHAHGIKVLGATLTPYVGSDYYHPGPASEADRVKLNDWMRHSGTFDGVVDFDVALRDSAHPDRLLPAYDSGDHLHPGPAGYKHMGEFVALSLLP